MRKLMTILVACFAIASLEASQKPLFSDTAALRTVDLSGDWKEIGRSQQNDIGIVEYVPIDQSPANWTDLICFQRINKTSSNKGTTQSIDHFLKAMQASTLSAFPGRKATFNVIEKSKSEAIYEWSLQEPYKNVQPQHEVVRVFLSKKAIHRVGYTKRNQMMSSQEHDFWLGTLKSSALVIPCEVALKQPKELMSCVNRLEEAYDLGIFSDWKVTTAVETDAGACVRDRLAPLTEKGYKSASLLSVVMPCVKMTIDEACSIIASLEMAKRSTSLTLEILEKSPTEIVLFSACPEKNGYVNTIIRVFLTDNTVYAFSVSEHQSSALNTEELAHWQQVLKQIRPKAETAHSTVVSL